MRPLVLYGEPNGKSCSIAHRLKLGYGLEVGMRLRIMRFHPDMRLRFFCILIYAVYADMRKSSCLFQTAYVSAYTNKSKYLYFKTLIVQTASAHLFEVMV